MSTDDNVAEGGIACKERERAAEPCRLVAFAPTAVFAGVAAAFKD